MREKLSKLVAYNIIQVRFRLCYQKNLDIKEAKHKAKFSLSPTKVTSNCRLGTPITIIGEISPDLYRFVQCDIKKCAFDSLKLEQNP